MLIAHYIGPPKPGLAAWIGWHLTVLAQKAPYDLCTHTEAIHALHADGTSTIASSSLADKGVRIKRGALAPVLPGRHDDNKVFCTEAVFAPFVQAPHYFSPALGLSLCLSIGKQVEI